MVLDQYNDYQTYEGKIALRLNEAWKAASKLQFEASQRNHKKRKQHHVQFEPGDHVDIWMRASSEQYMRLRNKKITTPKGFRNAWVGPYRVTSKIDNNHYLVNYKNKNIKHNVNRLRLNVHWDNVNRDTHAWYDRRFGKDLLDDRPEKKRKVVEVKLPEGIDLSVQAGIEIEPLRIGEEIIWRIPKEKISIYGDRLPFGVGIVKDVSDPAHLVCHILGNASKNASGQYQPKWYQKSDKMVYFHQNPLHHSHVKCTTANTYLANTTLSGDAKLRMLTEKHSSKMGSSDVVYRAASVRNKRFGLSAAARDAMMKDPYIFEQWGSAVLKAEKAISKSIKRKR
jgi:hypothetical protein